MALFGVAAAAFGAGAYVGVQRVQACEEATYALRERLMKIPARPWPPAGQPSADPQDYPSSPKGT